MRHRRVWLELGIVVVSIALLAAWMRPRVEEQQPGPSSQPAGTPAQGLRFLGKNTQGFEEYENLKDGSVLIQIPGGTFTMGSNDGETDEKPPHQVTLPPYLIGRVPVTNAQFARFVSASGYDARSSWRNLASESGDQAPVVDVTWYDATAYCGWAGVRLPTEEEWEHAAGGPQGYAYPWGNKWDTTRCRNSVGKSTEEISASCRTAPVGSDPSGASPFGCLDMVGSVWQWTSSRYDRYPGNTKSSGRVFEFGHTCRVMRGGSFANAFPECFRVHYRGPDTPNTTYFTHGFRCALTP